MSHPRVQRRRRGVRGPVMLHHAECHLLYEARARGERYRAEARAHARAAEALGPRATPRVREVLAGALARLARTLAAVAEDLDPKVARPSCPPPAA